MQLATILNKEFDQSPALSAEEISQVQRELGMVLPSDLVFLYLQSDGLKLKAGYELTLDGKAGYVEISNIFSAEWLIKERQYDIEDEDAQIYLPSYLKIANTFSQDRVLIGTQVSNLNQVFLFDYNHEEIIKVGESLVDFINTGLISASPQI